MGIRANIILTDGAGTPVNRTYYPMATKDKVLFWIDRTQPIFAGQNQLSLLQRPAAKDAPAYKFDWKLSCPILAELSSGGSAAGYTADPKVAYTNLANLGFVFHERSTLQERKDVLYQTRDLIDEAIMTNLVENLDMIW
jgi:hypothetical protein